MIRIRVFPTPDALAHALAADIARSLAANPRLVLGLPTGRTPIPLYRELVRLHARGRAGFRRAATFNLDEFVGLAPGDPRSYQSFMRRHLFSRIDLPSKRAHFLNGAAADSRAECARYERAIVRAGGIDLQILGLGRNGHVGFNEPGHALTGETHRVRLARTTRRANAALFGNRTDAVPKEALSMGIATILRARRIVLLATGSTKGRAVLRTICGTITTHWPASFLQLHPHAEAWLDRSAASRLTPRPSRPSTAP